ncbi:MAG: SGNH/GDSL hydrolase family protein [Bacteroidales bacterium]|nr:SGNH/GDSL hydrolase family protein [Bacteroidales bacterium]
MPFSTRHSLLRRFQVTLLMWCLVFNLMAQNVAWDNTRDKRWPAGFTQGEIPSSVDTTLQKAWFYAACGETPRPLLVSLHTWSGDYTQEDPLAAEAMLHNWNYIHPDFRGANNHPGACGSPLTIADMADAIRYARDHSPAGTAEIHVAGVSGGGHAALMAFLQLPVEVASFSAWVPVTDLEAWYHESLARKNRYAVDVLRCTSHGDTLGITEAHSRSPLFAPIKVERKGKTTLRIYAGIHDGYTGSVPISHAVTFFNRMAREWHPSNRKLPVTPDLLLKLVTSRTHSQPETLLTLANRKVHLLREAPGLSLTLFEGTHEMLVPQAFSLIPAQGQDYRLNRTILTIGDSNGAAINGWPRQLSALLPWSRIINLSVSGNTIGFDNLGRHALNTLRNLNQYLDSAITLTGGNQGPDCIIFGLGTNDAKQVFADSTQVAGDNMELLLHSTKSWFREKGVPIPRLIVLTPPPMEEHLADHAKYGGGNQRISTLNRFLKRAAHKQGAHIIDIHALFPGNTPGHTTDGVHLTGEAQLRVAQEIIATLMH